MVLTMYVRMGEAQIIYLHGVPATLVTLLTGTMSPCMQPDLCKFLNAKPGEQTCYVYHADLSEELLTAVYCEWQEGIVKILVATNALGLGIDYAHVRFVIHQ